MNFKFSILITITILLLMILLVPLHFFGAFDSLYGFNETDPGARAFVVFYGRWAIFAVYGIPAFIFMAIIINVLLFLSIKNNKK